MSYDLINYFNRKFAKLYPQTSTNEPGPFITISRETGCAANIIAENLKEKLSKQSSDWKIINKEIIDQAAGKLKVDKQRINNIIHAKHRTVANEILDALSTRYYKNDKTVLKAIAEVVKHDAEEGNIIIVGRGGVAVTQTAPNGIHIKLTAPLEWRINSMVQRRGMTREEATALIKENDKKRAQLLEHLSHKKNSTTLFDLVINCATFSPPQTVSLILEAINVKQLLG
jgi:cytidylate kinase